MCDCRMHHTRRRTASLATFLRRLCAPRAVEREQTISFMGVDGMAAGRQHTGMSTQMFLPAQRGAVPDRHWTWDGEMRYGNRPNRPCDQMRLVWTHTKGCRMAASSMPVLTKASALYFQINKSPGHCRGLVCVFQKNSEALGNSPRPAHSIFIQSPHRYGRGGSAAGRCRRSLTLCPLTRGAVWKSCGQKECKRPNMKEKKMAPR
jgi:hypothetical protein